ncbi:terminase [Methylobacterium sp. Leaf399]|uniref:PBSX family phage terminase large subunit n=1 Tax=unclassified Methylobacterium TaxID=2615210 RepID=UPI0006F87DE4|nr:MULTISPECIES: PBSX family phage terminase large subunit [unclassified Methylobacterium]KQP50826.1 terminase [Methylobacterium sp. Leaf108]KQT07807.1 terminase [Methylobacterium sp. Leaf399]KQT88922.1 terminase [Methylobacterium sp. Leaf466]
MTIEFPEKLAFLFEPARYKIAYGGRGGAKSWGFGRALLILGAQRPLRVLCAREFQNSIAESAHALLAQQIDLLGLSRFYEIQEKRIYGTTGTEFIFKGLRHNVASVKSTEGVDVCWVEEARTVSKSSWDVLIPTIRKPGSEIWVSFNTELEGDETYQRFVKRPPTGAQVVKIGWEDNPWFPEVLRQEALDLKERDPIAYETVWGGNCKQVLDGAIYANEILAATRVGRFTKVHYDPSKPVHTFWDLGRADKTSIWFAQIVGFEFRLIDYYENRGHALTHYLDVLKARSEPEGEAPGYVYGEHWLPHDARNELLASERTIEQQMWAAGHNVRITPKLPVAAGIDAARQIFDRCWFDEDRCADGLQALRNYRYEVDPDTQRFSKTPLHDWASHGADAFRYFAVGIAEPREDAPPPSGPNDVYARRRRERHEPSGSGWST